MFVLVFKPWKKLITVSKLSWEDYPYSLKRYGKYMKVFCFVIFIILVGVVGTDERKLSDRSCLVSPIIWKKLVFWGITECLCQ